MSDERMTTLSPFPNYIHIFTSFSFLKHNTATVKISLCCGPYLGNHLKNFIAAL